jgi:hypothetical protein
MRTKLDYACHEIEAKKLIREASDLLTRSRFVDALEMIDDAIVELRMMKAAVNSHIPEKNG